MITLTVTGEDVGVTADGVLGESDLLGESVGAAVSFEDREGDVLGIESVLDGL